MKPASKQTPKPSVPAVPAASDSTALMSIISRVASEKDYDVEKLERLLALKERYDQTEARKAFEAAVSAAKAQLKPIVKNRTVDFTSQKGRTNYVYEDFAQVATQVDPVLAEHGLSYRFRSKQDGKTLAVSCILAHRDGHTEETTLTAQNDESGNKNSIQSIGSAATYLQRYTLKLALGLAAAKDDDAQSAEDQPKVSDEQIAKLEALIKEGGGSMGRALNFLGLQSLGELPAVNFEFVYKQIQTINNARKREATKAGESK